MRIVRIAFLLGCIIAVVGIAVTAWLALAPGATGFAGESPVLLADYRGVAPTGVPASLAKAPLLVRGEYLTRAADCAACHTAKGGRPFSGGRAFKLPFGTLYTPNITPDVATGIGRYTDAEFLKAVHKGVSRSGQPLYPAFPYSAYTMMTDADVLAIKAYLFSLAPVTSTAPANTLGFPFNQRWLMTIWGVLFNSDKRFEPVPERSAQWNRGAYLVEAAGHCGDCHSPRNPMQAVDQRQKFAGGAAEGWTAYNITGDRLTGVGAWSRAELAAYLSTGHASGRGTASGPMGEVVELSLRHLTSEDIDAIVTYIRTIPAIHSAGLPDRLAGPAPAVHTAGFDQNPRGKAIFEGNCASCHAWDGSGALIAEAQLTGSRAVNDPAATNAAQMILSGAGHANSGRPYMPSFAAAYTDTEIAAVANYVGARFGAPSKVTATQVKVMRGES
ncbi:MAG: c-type cytochrome [Janthinobacterium lividum]